jgi:hypothetical protein
MHQGLELTAQPGRVLADDPAARVASLIEAKQDERGQTSGFRLRFGHFRYKIFRWIGKTECELMRLVNRIDNSSARNVEFLRPAASICTITFFRQINRKLKQKNRCSILIGRGKRVLMIIEIHEQAFSGGWIFPSTEKGIRRSILRSPSKLTKKICA